MRAPSQSTALLQAGRLQILSAPGPPKAQDHRVVLRLSADGMP